MDKQLKHSIIGSIFNGSFAGLVTGTMILIGVRSAVINLSVEKQLLEKEHQAVVASKLLMKEEYTNNLNDTRQEFLHSQMISQEKNAKLEKELLDVRQKYDLLKKSLD